ncbi:MAG: PaaI family thioesterase [Pseudomonadota bacterium]
MSEDIDNQSGLKNHLGIEVHEIARGEVKTSMQVRPFLTAPDGHLHAASVVALAIESAGVGCMASLPAEATGFSTIELKTNHLGSPHAGWIDCRAYAVHMGRTTQVWDADITHRETGKKIAMLRCTQFLAYPRN